MEWAIAQEVDLGRIIIILIRVAAGTGEGREGHWNEHESVESALAFLQTRMSHVQP